jgi:hypothetical protein
VTSSKDRWISLAIPGKLGCPIDINNKKLAGLFASFDAKLTIILIRCVLWL